MLLVEDDENDIVLVRKAAEASAAGHTVHGVRDGEEAIAYLKGIGQFADRERFPLPNVILTDLKMPGMSGFDLLRWLRSNPSCAIIPTIVYSSSRLERDVQEAYRLGANSYIGKPVGLTALVEILHAIYEYWSRCECPPIGQTREM